MRLCNDPKSCFPSGPQQSVSQWRPFSNDNEANAHKSKWWHLKNIRHWFHWMVPDCQALTCRANDTGARHMLRVSSSVWQGNRSSQWVADDMKRLGIQVYCFHKLKWPCWKQVHYCDAMNSDKCFIRHLGFTRPGFNFLRRWTFVAEFHFRAQSHLLYQNVNSSPHLLYTYVSNNNNNLDWEQILTYLVEFLYQKGINVVFQFNFVCVSMTRNVDCHDMLFSWQLLLV